MVALLKLFSCQLFFGLSTLCPNGWQDAIGVCYIQMASLTDFVPWGVAQYMCARLDPRAHLPVFKDPLGWRVFQMGVKQFKATLVLVGPPPGVQLPSTFAPFGGYRRKNDDKYFWVDDSEIALGTQYWQAGQPNATNDTNCVGFNIMSDDTGYSAIKCNDRYGYVCQMEFGDDPAPKLAENHEAEMVVLPNTHTTCPTGWSLIDHICYYSPVDPIVIIDDGAKTCQSLNANATMLKFYNQPDFKNFLYYFGKEVTTAQHLDVALANRRDGQSGDYPIDGKKSYFQNFHYSKKEVGNSDCVVMNDIYAFYWKSIDCKSKAFLICQIDDRSIKTSYDTKKKEDNQKEKSDSGVKLHCLDVLLLIFSILGIF